MKLKTILLPPPQNTLVSLVSLTNQVVGQSLNGGRGVAGNLRFAVVADDNGLLRLGNGDTEAALQ